MNNESISKRLEVKNKLGLHARAAAQVVQAVLPFEAAVELSRDGTTVDGRSILGVMSLGADIGTWLDVTCSGPDAAAALAAVEALFEQKFNED
ncbi:HPr family phosphocarrier protein [Candidatus Binatia bacterium]|nr:HPr family phosphocarrier protein [Candidatus Binatia bacterium]